MLSKSASTAVNFVEAGITCNLLQLKNLIVRLVSAGLAVSRKPVRSRLLFQPRQEYQGTWRNVSQLKKTLP